MTAWRLAALMCLTLHGAWAQPTPPTRALPLSQLQSGLHFSGKDVQALQADAFANPAQLWLGLGETLWRQTGDGKGNGKGPSCFSCHGEASQSMKGVATRYPAIDARNGRLMNVEDRINQCTTQRQKKLSLEPESDAMLSLTLLVAQASQGQPLHVNITGAAKQHWQKGAALFNQRQGQLNLSCAQCHDQNFSQRLYVDPLSQGQPNGYPVYRLEWQKLGSLERRLRSCYSGIRAELPPWGATEMRQLALYLMWRGEGLAIEVPAVRK